jgi:Immunoglobulin domain
MKKTIVQTILFAIALAASFTAHATLAWYEGFNYADGGITNVSANTWLKFSGNPTNGVCDMYVASHQLQVAATISGTSTTPLSRQDDCRRPLATTPANPITNTVQVLYASFTVICTNLPNGVGSYFAAFYSVKNGYFGRVQAFTNGSILPNTWRIGATANGSGTNKADGGYPVDLALNTPYQIVEELDPTPSGLQAATIWVNPTDVYQSGSSPTQTHYTSSDTMGSATTSPVTDYAFRQAGSFGNSFFIITNLALATTFAEAATNVWKTNALPPVIVYQPSIGTTNYTGAALSFSIVANGQGLGNLSYRWQLNGVDYTANPSTTNVLTISSAATTDSGDFRAIVTTPYGLSVTSSVSHVLITDAPVPPTFVTQPITTSTFVGNGASLSTSVIGPSSGDPVTFTWYSNNVVVTSGQSDSGHSSTFTLYTANPFTATFKVAATNAYGGIISTSAPVTISAIPTVTVAYLRKLVDPNNNWTATNSTLPYTVTGVITTYTNLTTGDTSSYYLQDATAGINIFATFGSTFRPAQGDVVTFTGVTSSFSSGLELYANPSTLPYTSYSDTGTGTLPAPLAIPFTITNTGYANMNTNIAGRLVQLSDVYFGTNAGLAITNGFMGVTNSLGQKFNLWISSQALDVIGHTAPPYASTVTGVVFGGQNSGSPNFAVAVTKFSDIVTATPPVITLQPVSTNAIIGGNAYFTVAATGGSLAYQWFNGVTSLTGATNSTLTISNLALTDAGSYTVQVSNSAGLTNSSVAVLVVSNQFYSVYDGGPGFFSGENLVHDDFSGLSFNVWSTTNISLPVTSWNLEGGAVEHPITGSSPATSHYGITVTPTATTEYYIFARTNVGPYLPVQALAWLKTSDNYTTFTLNTTNAPISTNGIFAVSVAPPASIPVNASLSGHNLTLSWTNSAFALQFSTNVAGPYSTVSGAASPYVVPATNAAGFYRLKY